MKVDQLNTEWKEKSYERVSSSKDLVSRSRNVFTTVGASHAQGLSGTGWQGVDWHYTGISIEATGICIVNWKERTRKQLKDLKGITTNNGWK